MDSSFPRGFRGLDASEFGALEDIFEGAGFTMEAKVRELVDSGMEDCFCGQSDCDLGIAIRAEIARRGGKPSSMSKADIKAAVRGALEDLGPEFELKIAKAMAAGVGVALMRERRRSLFLMLDHFLGTVLHVLGILVVLVLTGISLVLLAPVRFLSAAFGWKKGKSYLKMHKDFEEFIKEHADLKEMAKLLGELPGGPDHITKAGWRFGAWVANRPESIRTTLSGWRTQLVARFGRARS